MMAKVFSIKFILIWLVCLATTCGAASAQEGVPHHSLEAKSQSITSPSEKVFERADWVFNNAELVHYGHKQIAAKRQVKSFSNGRCQSNTDCSGFVSYVLSEFPRQYKPIREMQPDRKYPQAKTYTQFFSALRSDKPSHGWLRIGHVSDLRQGDVIAWKKPEPPPGVKKANTGHVMIVIRVQENIEETEVNGKAIKYQNITVIDSSSVKHFPPEELPPLTTMAHRDGVGKGVVRIILDEQNHPIGYWEGTFSYQSNKEIRKPTFTDSIAFARLVADDN